MALYFVDYDLRKQRNYDALYAALHALGAKRFLESSWALQHNSSTSVALRDYLSAFIDADDGLMVSQVSTWASRGVKITPDKL